MIPQTQLAVQLVGKDQLELNRNKTVHEVGPTQILAKIEAVGLCFSDLKLLKQFSEHPRKSDIIAGITKETLSLIPSYVPGTKPTVPGHEVVVTIVKVGSAVSHHKVGERCLVQTDYRGLPTKGSNASFGYNFEGALQEYVLMDEQVIIDSNTGERYLIPAKETLSASEVALVEPWACVEDSYVTPERRRIKKGGKLLIAIDPGRSILGLTESLESPDAYPKELAILCTEPISSKRVEEFGFAYITVKDDPSSLPDEYFDDIVYFGSNKQLIEALNDKLAPRGIFNIVRGDKKIGEPVSVGVGRLHYGMTRWIGTTTNSAIYSYSNIPVTGEIRDDDTVAIIGAGGPMGQMHAIRNICAGKKSVTVIGADFDDQRLASLFEKAAPIAKQNGVKFVAQNTQKEPLSKTCSYVALMAPVGALVAQAIGQCTKNGIINIFAGIPATVKEDLDLDTYIENHLFMFGTSGSTIRDMKLVLEKVETGKLNTNLSIDAVSGMAGAIDGIRAVENRTLAGKIIVYPSLHNTGLIALKDIVEIYPSVAKKLNKGLWTKEAEEELLKVAQ